jgi:serine/threonine protein kinase
MDFFNSKKKIENDYIFDEKILGKGQYGVIKKAFCIKTGIDVAIKIIPKNNLKKGTSKSNTEQKLMREVNIMKLCNHPHIIRYINFYDDSNNYYIVMEYIKHGDLFDLVAEKQTLNYDDAKKIFSQLVSAIEYCHGNLVAHRDIKLENVLVSNMEELSIILADFGLSNYIKLNTLHNTLCGSVQYCAPEIINRDKYNPIKSDIWSMGVVLYCMVSGGFPFDIKQMINNSTTYVYDTYNILDNNLNDLLSKIFVPASERITINGIKNHPWLSGYTIPSYLPVRAAVQEINLILVDKIVSLGFEPNEILLSLYNNSNTQETAIYHLLMEKIGKKTPRVAPSKYFTLSQKTKKKSKSTENLFDLE